VDIFFWGGGGVHLALSIGGVIAERNILHRFAYSRVVKMSPVDLAGGSGNRNMYFKQKLHVQMASLNFCADINGLRTVNFKENLRLKYSGPIFALLRQMKAY
jgi:hypothetical protein